MLKEIKKNIILICLLVSIVAMPGCRKMSEIETGWVNGRYDLIANVSRVELDKIGYDLGTPSARTILVHGWSEDLKSLDGRTYIRAKEKIAIMKLPPMSPISRVLSFQAFSSGLPGNYASLVLNLNGHFLKKIKLRAGWRIYSVPIKGRYFSRKENLLVIEQTLPENNHEKHKLNQKKKLNLALDKLYLIKKELVHQAESIEENFVRIHRLRLGGDTRSILMTKPNIKLSYNIFLHNPAELRFSLGLHEEEIEKMQYIEFKILAKNNKQGERLLFSRSYGANIDKLSKGWEDFKVEISALKGSSMSLSFQTNVTLKKDCKLNSIYWGNPFITNSQREQTKGLNVIIYLIDALRADHLGCYGNSRIKTPHIDKFASDAVLFQKAFTQCSWTKPSVGSLFTSTYPTYHGAIGRKDGLTEQVTTLAECLRDNGYFTAAYINQPHLSAGFGFYQGFDSYVQTYYPLKNRPLYAHYMNQLIFPWLENKAETPFFLYIHTIDPHDPYSPPPPFDTMYDNDYTGSIDGSGKILTQINRHKIQVSQRDIRHLEALYDGEVTLNDLAFGKLIEKLKELQLYDRTLIIFLADHGEEFYEHEGLLHGQTLYEEQINIPLIMRLPSHLPTGMKISSMVRIIDIMPAILDLFNLPIPAQCQGESLIPLIKGNTKSLVKEVYAEEDLDGRVLQSIRTRKWKLIYYPKTKALELFNLIKDPEEKHNVAVEYPELASSLREKIKLWQKEQIMNRVGLDRPQIQKLSEETIKQLKALGYLN